jgi:hypothetical protein
MKTMTYFTSIVLTFGSTNNTQNNTMRQNTQNGTYIIILKLAK